MYVTLLFVAVGLLAAQAVSQEISGWSNILNCTNDFGGVGTTIYDFHEGFDIVAMAQQVRTWGSCGQLGGSGEGGERRSLKLIAGGGLYPRRDGGLRCPRNLLVLGP